jgi:hypothetical protein
MLRGELVSPPHSSRSKAPPPTPSLDAARCNSCNSGATAALIEPATALLQLLQRGSEARLHVALAVRLCTASSLLFHLHGMRCQAV